MSAQLIYRRYGEGPSITFLHGWGLNSGVFDILVESLQQDFEVTLIDIPGYGENYDKMPEYYDLTNLVSMLRGIVPKNSTLVGWSMGGLVAQQFAIEHPSYLEKLILVSSTPKFSQQDNWPGIKANVLETFKHSLNLDFVKTLGRFMAIQAMGSEHAKSDIKRIQKAVENYHSPNFTALKAGLDLLDNQDLRENSKNIKVPIVGFFGKKDTLVPVSAVEAIKNYLPTMQTEVFEKASHAPFISHHQEFIEKLRKYL